METVLSQFHDEGWASTRQPQSGSRHKSPWTPCRGLTILLMIFVNDLGHGAPSWMHPSSSDAHACRFGLDNGSGIVI